MAKIFNPQKDIIPSGITHIVSDIDGVITTDDKKEIAPGIAERLKKLKECGVIVILNTLRGYPKYTSIIQGEIQNIIESGISERGAIHITKDNNIIPLVAQEYIDKIKKCNYQIENSIIKKGAVKGPGPYSCIQYYFADNKTCQKIVEDIKLGYEDLTLEATGQRSIILTKKGVDKGYGIQQLLTPDELKNTLILGDDKVDESMFTIPGVTSFNVGKDKTLQSSYITAERGYKATIKILDELLLTLKK